MKMNKAEREALIGHKIEWGEHYDRHRGTYMLRTGVVQDVKWKNILIDDDWKWIEDMNNIKVIE